MEMEKIDAFLATLPESAFRYQGKFSPKLSGINQQCEVLAWHMKGVNRVSLAEAFGLNKRTVSAMYNEKSPHYKRVRAIRDEMGADAFMKEYITEEGTMKVAAVVNASITRGPNRNSNAQAGVHLLDSIMNDGKHRIVIEWCDVHEEGPGWYYKDLDSDWPTMWLHNDEESRISSNACLKAVKENL